MRSPHIIPLSPQALAVVEELRPLTGPFDLLFPSQRTEESPSPKIPSLRPLPARLPQARHRARFRALASTILNETGFRPDVIERQLAHVEAEQGPGGLPQV